MIVISMGETVINSPVFLFVTQDCNPIYHQNAIQLNLDCDIRSSELLLIEGRTKVSLL